MDNSNLDSASQRQTDNTDVRLGQTAYRATTPMEVPSASSRRTRQPLHYGAGPERGSSPEAPAGPQHNAATQGATPVSNGEPASGSSGPPQFQFHGQVVFEARPEAIFTARNTSEAAPTLNHYVLWTGLSRSPDSPVTGYSIANKFIGDRWRLRVRRAAGLGKTIHHSLKTIQLALEDAIEHAELWPPTFYFRPTVTIFTSDTVAFKSIHRLPCSVMETCSYQVDHTLAVLKSISTLSRRLADLGSNLELRWAPKGRIPARLVARQAALYARSTPDGLREQSWTFPRIGPGSQYGGPHGQAVLDAEISTCINAISRINTNRIAESNAETECEDAEELGEWIRVVSQPHF